MGMEPTGMAARFAAMRARQMEDRLGRDAELIRAALNRRRGVDGPAMLASLAEDVRVIEAGRAARAQRNAAKARFAYSQYQAARAVFAAERDQDAVAEGGPSLLVAAAMHMGQAPVRIC